MKKVLFAVLLTVSAFSGVPSAAALAAGLAFALVTGGVFTAFSYRLHAFSLFAAASRSPSAAARRCALGADRSGIALDCDAVVGS